MFDHDLYNIIGIGEFSHGVIDIWQYRFNLLKHVIKNTNKKINIFNEMSVWQADNIRNFTVYSNQHKKYIKCNHIKKETPIQSDNYVGGVYWQYINHAMESVIFIKIIKYIRKHNDRIFIYGIDNDKLDRDYFMYSQVLKRFNKNYINYVWAHNHHINSSLLNTDTTNYIKNKNHIYTMGYYLKQKFKDKYCIILSQAYQGENRFNGYCYGISCNSRRFQLNYIYHKFKHNECKKYINNKSNHQLLKYFDSNFICFSNSFYDNNKYGAQSIVKYNNTWSYVLFFNIVSKLV